MTKKISNKNKWIICLYINSILVGQYIGALIVFPVLIKDIVFVLLYLAIIDYGIFELLNCLRLDTRTNKIFERDDEEC